MGFLSSFIEKTLDAVKNGKKLDDKEVKILENVLEKRANSVRVASKAFAAAILISSKDDGKIEKGKIKRISIIFETIIDAAIRNSIDGKEPFPEPLRKKLIDVFDEVGFNGKIVSAKFMANFDLLQGEVLKESLISVEKNANRLALDAIPPDKIMPKEDKIEPIEYKKELNRRV